VLALGPGQRGLAQAFLARAFNPQMKLMFFTQIFPFQILFAPNNLKVYWLIVIIY
jgi:hypothetical protein